MVRRTTALLGAVALLAGCDESPTAVSQDVNLETLRRVMAPFRQFERAAGAGWSSKITACMEAPTGGMGFHYGNPAVIDGSVRVDEPELLLYEPDQSDTLRLVAVEYIVPYAARGRDGAPPVLFGRAFKRNDTFQLWGLHVWAWRDNPSGRYADWNPRVSCAHTTDVAAMAHH